MKKLIEMKKNYLIYSLSALMFLGAITFIACDKAAVLVDFGASTNAAFVFVDVDSTANNPIYASDSVNMHQLDSVFSKNNSKRSDVRSFTIKKVQLRIDTADTTGNFNAFQSASLSIEGDSAGIPLPTIEIAHKDNIPANVRLIDMDVPSKDLVRYIHAEHLFYTASVQPTAEKSPKIKIRAFVNYVGKAKVNK